MGLVTGQAKPQRVITLCLNTELPFMFPVYAEIFLPQELYSFCIVSITLAAA